MTRADLAAWLLSALIPPGVTSHGLMNPPGAAGGKYMVVHRPLTAELIAGALSGATRRPEVEGRRQTCPVSLAGVLRNADGQALAAAVDVDDGGAAAVAQVLETCERAGLWAFAQLSESEQHSGGHVWIPFDRPLPAADLLNLAKRLQAAAEVEGEAWPTGQLLRLPAMPHLHAPGGPRRLPLLFHAGEVIDAADPCSALSRLRAEWRPNTPAQLADADRALAPLGTHNRQRYHASKVNPANPDSVIAWYNDNVSLEKLLSSVGVDAARLGAYTCKWHDDKSPSLVVWRHNRTGRTVCRCYSKHSACPAADVPYLDSFNLAQLPGMELAGMTVGEAVHYIADKYHLGQRRELRHVEHVAPTPPPPDALAQHAARVGEARAKVANILAQAKDRRGAATVIKATPGLGKTHMAADLANAAHAKGLTVAVVVGRLDFAEEWTRRLNAPYVWQARARACECQDRAALKAWAAKGYTLPKCEPWCPYERQKAERAGHVTIYQYPHLGLDDGRLIAGADLVIIDESPLDVLLEPGHADAGDVGRLAVTLGNFGDPGAPLAVALSKVITAQALARQALDGGELVKALAAQVGDVRAAVKAARSSPFGNPHPLPPAAEEKAPATLPRQWWGRFLLALAHDAAQPERNPLTGWGSDGEAWRLTWYERPRVLESCRRLDAPAVIVLDGSASEAVARQLYAPWPVEFVQVDAPPSPTVRVVQVPTVASTRRSYGDATRVDSVARSIAMTCNALGVTLDGGLCYKAATDQLAERLGGTWLHYGGQRGTNALEGAQVLAIVASPTPRPDAMLRKAQALWSDAPRLDTNRERVGVAAFRYADPRLQAFADLAGAEELRQAAHRARPILSRTPTTLLIFSPWDLAALGLEPSATIAELPHGNAAEARDALGVYHARRGQMADSGTFQSGKSKRDADLGQIEKPLNPPLGAPSISPPRGNGHAPPVPASAWIGGRLCRLGPGGEVQALDMMRGWLPAPGVPAAALALAALAQEVA